MESKEKINRSFKIFGVFNQFLFKRSFSFKSRAITELDRIKEVEKEVIRDSIIYKTANKITVTRVILKKIKTIRSFGGDIINVVITQILANSTRIINSTFTSKGRSYI